MKLRKQNAPTRRMIPEDEQMCIWMTTGMVSYKICDRNFECESCPLNLGLTGNPTLEEEKPASKR